MSGDDRVPRVDSEMHERISREMDEAFERNLTRDFLRRGQPLPDNLRAAALAAFERWQATPSVHPLTCGNDSRHRPLIATVEEQQIILRCPDCDYRQSKVPHTIMELPKLR